MVGAKKLVQSAVILAALVLVGAVAGAFADGVPAPHQAALLNSQALQLNPVAASHADLTLGNHGNHDPSNGLRKGYLLHASVMGDDDADDSSSDDPTTTPEPGTALLLLVGVGLLFFTRRRAFES